MDTETHPLLKALEAEQNRLVTAIEASAEYRKLQQINETVVMYGGRAVGVGAARPKQAPQDPEISAAISKMVERKQYNFDNYRQFGYGEKTRAIHDVAVDFLRERGYRAPSADFLPAMEAAKIEIGGKNPARTMASFLSTLPQFNNVKPHGYGLVEWGDGLGPRGYTLEATMDMMASHENEPSTGEPEDGSETGAATPNESHGPKSVFD